MKCSLQPPSSWARRPCANSHPLLQGKRCAGWGPQHPISTELPAVSTSLPGVLSKFPPLRRRIAWCTQQWIFARLNYTHAQPGGISESCFFFLTIYWGDEVSLPSCRSPGANSVISRTETCMGRTKSQTLDVFPPSDCCFTHYEFYENCVEWNGDLLGRLKAMLMEQATPEWLLCPHSFQSKFSQSHSNAAADDCSSWQSPFLNSSLRKWAKTSPHQIQFGLSWKAPGCTLVWAVLNFQFQFQCSWTS